MNKAKSDDAPPSIEYNEYKGHDEHRETVAGEAVLSRPERVFSAAEEKALYRKIDIRIMPILSILYLLSFMDRGNIGNARLNGLERDLNMTGFDYNIALTAYFLTYCFAEVPANLMLKKLRPSIWLASITLVWGLVMTLMGVVQSYGGLIACRLALGIAESGLFPGVVLYISMWYPRHECQYRIALFFGAATMAGAFSGLLAYGIGFMDGVRGYAGWRWIFILEGTWLKHNDAGSVGEAEGISWKYIIQALTSWQVWLSTIYYISIVTPLYSVGLFLPTIINSFGKYTRPQVQLLTIPVYVFACAWVLVSAILSDKYRTRFPFVFFDQCLCFVGFIINITPAPSGVKLFGLFLVAAGSYGGLPSVVTWLGNNLAGQTKRGVGMAFQIGIGNLGGIASSNIYRSKDSPHYYLGHGVNLGLLVLGLIASPMYAFLLKRANARKTAEQAVEDSLPEAEKRVYSIQELRDLGDRQREFVYTI